MRGPTEAQKPLMLLVLTMWLSSAFCSIGRNARAPLETPPQQMLNVRSHSSLLLVIMLPPPLIPALLNNKWILSVWWWSATSSRNRSTCVRSATSAMCVVTRSPCGNPAASHSLCVSARPVGETSHIATLQASATSWRTSSRPIPLPPPVTTAVLPANSVMSVLPCVLGTDLDMALQPTSPPVRGIVISRSSDEFYHLRARGGSG